MEGALCRTDLKLIETLRWDGRRLVRLERHLGRLARSAAALGFAFDAAEVRALLETVRSEAEPRRVRLALARDGGLDLSTTPLGAASPARWRVVLAGEALASDDPALGHKTTARERYDRARRALPEGIDEVIFANERGEICEGTISNVFFDAGEGLATPPLGCGLLPGVLREELLAAGRCRESLLPVAALGRVRLWCGNSLRGLIPATLAAASAPPEGMR